VLDALRKEGIEKNTLVFFTSDNGPWIVKDLAGGSAGPFRDGKGSTWEGGLREPGIAWWPGKIKPHTLNHQLACSLDFFPTIMSLAGVSMPTDRVYDGYDIGPMLFGKGPSKREVIYYYRTDQLFALRKGAYKAHFFTRTGYSAEGPQDQQPPLLYNVENDPGEKVNVAAEHPEILADLHQEYDRHNKTLVRGTPQY
jgi:arylsulfatase A-like enzyme